MSIGSFSVRNPVFINILMVIILVLGVFSITRLPKEQFSEVPFFWVNIAVPYPGAAAEDVEEAVTVKVEREMEGIDSLKRIQSVTSEGLSLVRVEFDDGISNEKFERLYQEVQTRFSKASLPEGTLDASIDDFSAADFLPVIEVILSGEVDFETLNTKAKELEERLRDVRDVSTVEAIGALDRNIQIEAQSDKLEALGISINEIIDTVGGKDVSIPGGKISTPSREYLMRTVGSIKEAEELGTLIVRTSRDTAAAESGGSERAGGSGGSGSGVVRIGDLARVREVYQEEGAGARFNGEPSVNLKISKVSRGDSLAVTEGVKDVVSDFEEEIPGEMSITIFNDSTVQITDSLNTLISNFVIGFILLIFILFLFIGLRNALITAAGIPVAFALTFILLDYLGESLNTNTLFGLVLVLGLIVDHAIVIIENSYRLQNEGLSRIDAAIEGTNQVVVPVLAATATTVAAFLPLMILPGTIGKFLRVIPLTVSVALIASTFEAFVFLPVHFAEWAGKAKTGKKRIFEALQGRYRKILSAFYRRRKLAFVGMSVFMLGTCSLVITVEQDLFSAEDFSLFYIEIEMPPGTPREKTDRTVRAFEDRLIPLVGNGEVTGINSSIGYTGDGSGSTAKNSVAEIIVDLEEKSRGRSRSVTAIQRDVEALCSDIPGAENIRYRKATNGPPTDPPVSFRLRGDNYTHLIDASRALQERLGAYPELYNITDTLEGGTPELKIRVDEARAARYGLDTRTVGSYIRTSFDGVTATTIFRDNEEIDVVVKFAEGNIDSVSTLSQIKIPSPSGSQVPFDSVATIEESTGIAGITRIDGTREVTVTAEAYSEERVRDINGEIEDYFDRELSSLYKGVNLITGGEFAEFDRLLVQILRIFLIGVFLIYLILGTQFKSYGQPFLILFSVPFAFTGVILFLVLSGTPFSTTVLYAGVALAGIAVNDSIVLVSFINELKEQNYTLEEAVLTASQMRLRPIILTSLTTIAGLLPTAIGIGGRSVVWGPMASTIVFGLLFSTLTALLLIPCLYGIFSDLRMNTRRHHGT
ncbi:MAG: efflux RND transporter permease subunit [Spirochaetaceae bacterium]